MMSISALYCMQRCVPDAYQQEALRCFGADLSTHPACLPVNSLTLDNEISDQKLFCAVQQMCVGVVLLYMNQC